MRLTRHLRTRLRWRMLHGLDVGVARLVVRHAQLLHPFLQLACNYL